MIKMKIEDKEVLLAKEERFKVRNISELEVYQGVFIYKLETFYNGNLLSEKQGVTNQETIDNYLATGEFKNDFGYNLVDVETMKKALKDHKTRYLGEDTYVLTPYDDGIVVDETVKHALIKDNLLYNRTIDDYIGTYHTIGIYMDYIYAKITEKHYDLNELLAVLKERDDIHFINGPKIEDIPYYNATDDEMRTIEFLWYPNEEEYNKYLRDTGMFGPAAIPTKVFGVNRKKYVD